MNAARRDKRRRDWPRGLYEPRPGYFVWRHPNGRTFPIGRVPLAVARGEAIAANAHVADVTPSLVARLSGAGQTVGDLLDKMPAAKAENTAKSWRSLDKKIRARLGDMACSQVETRHCAELIEAEADSGQARSAEALRSRLIAVCKRGQGLGWMVSNPAEATSKPDVVVKRGRLTIESFRAIYAKAPEVAEWLQRAMMLAIVTGQDVSTIAAMERSHVADGYLTTWRTKTRGTNQPIAIPLALRLDAVGVALADIVAQRTGVVSRYLVHHVNAWGNAPTGSAVHKNRISRAFTLARQLAGIPDESAPTFHEIRSLCKRLYEKQGGVDTKALLGHATERAADIYADPRGIEPIRVKVG